MRASVHVATRLARDRATRFRGGVEARLTQRFDGLRRFGGREHAVLTLAIVALAWVALPLVAPFEDACIVHPSPPGAPLLRAPSPEFFLGTDTIGRSEALRLAFALRTSTGLALPATLLATMLAVPLGALAALAASRRERRAFSLSFDDLFTLVVDVLLALPFLLVVAAAAALVDDVTALHLVAVMTFASLPATAKLVRDRALFLHARGYVQAAYAVGASGWQVLVRHVLPPCARFALTLAPTTFAQLVVAEAALGYLGLGLPPPAATLGSMLADGQDTFTDAPWLLVVPCVALVTLVLGAETFSRVLEASSREAEHG
jgi:peptide/nickel transport system permease protein